MCHIVGPVSGRHEAGAVPEPDDQFPGQSAGGDSVGAELRDMLAALGGLAGHAQRGRHVDDTRPEPAVLERNQLAGARHGSAVPVDLRTAQQQVVRRVLSPGFVLLADVRHAVLLLAHLQGGRAHDPGDQPGVPDDAQPPGVR